MKKLAFLALVLFTCYWASMYRSLPLMALCVAEFLLLVVLLVLPRIFRAHLTARFVNQSQSTMDGVEAICRISVRNSGRLPVSRVGLRLRVRYDARYKKSKKVKKKLYGGGTRGETLLEFHVRPVYCGLVQVRMDRLRAFDYLTLFSSRKRLKEEMKIAVFPREQALRIAFNSTDWEDDRSLEEQTFSRSGDSLHEIRQIREYRIGDSNRHIHWNQSAKTDQMWIKEYEKELDFQADVLLDPTGFSRKSAGKVQEWSAFYKLLSALILGLLQEAAAVRVHWCPKGGSDYISTEISGAEQCRNMLLQLYQTGFAQGGHTAFAQSALSGSYCFRLTAGLTLYAENTLLYQFSAKDLEQELQEKSFTI